MHQSVVVVLVGACALAAGMGIGRFAYTPLLPHMQRELDLTLTAAGYVASANFLGYLAGALIAMGAHAAHRRRGFVAGLLGSVATTLLMALFSDPWLLGAIRAGSGVASAFVLIHGSAIALDALARAGRPALFSLLYAGVGAGIAVTAVLVEAMSRAGAGASPMWLVLGAVATVLASPALLLRDDSPHPAAAAATPTSPAPPPPTDRQALAWLTAAYGCLGFGYVITVTFIVVMVRGRADWQPYEMAVWLCVGLAGAPSNYLWIRIAQRFGVYRAMIAAYLLEGVGVVAAASGAHIALVMFGGVLLGGTFLAITALGLSTARGLARADSGRIVGRMTAFFGLGQILGPALGGWLAERTGSFAAPSMLAAATLVAAAAMVERSRRLQRLSGSGPTL